MNTVELKKNGDLRIQFNGIGFTTSLNQVKTLSGRSFHKGPPVRWEAPPLFENLEKLKEWKFSFNREVSNLWKELNKKAEEITNIDLSNHPALKRAYPFQVNGVEFIESRNGRALIGDEMGLGKTVQALCYLKLHPELRPAVIVCPASLKLNWKKECKTWINEPCNVISGTTGAGVSNQPIQIINYDILDKRVDILNSEIKPKVLILDEIHYIKNQKTKRSKAVKKLAKKIKHIIGLSGTPIINRPVEFFPMLNLLDPMRWKSFWNYAHKFCGAKHNGFGWDFNGSSNPEDLHEAVKYTMIRRLKKDVLPDLPAKIRTVIPVEITNRKEYNQMVSELNDSDSPAIQLTRIEKLKQLVVEGKIDSCISWINDFLVSEEKLVVFCTHKKIISILENEFNGKCVKIDGSCSQNQKQKAVNQFQNDLKTKLFIGNIKAAGVGLTLTAASSTCFIELAWDSGSHDQAEDRVHRIGQEADSVNAYYLLGQDTIDMEIAVLLDEKRKVLDSVLDGKETDESGLLTELMARLKGDN